ncbi:hypothetical protein DRW03_20350 [Corallococcus sp. H22C18031201]|uniref:hypothetical protein n=1 Tax=Citreicoccus inhibens TaxID=2849499 RepID=UPI000E76DAA1|nr:hypothetical protein [Citreicoccus inhibens]MBU8895687.1 hypothetical protein [Citreicoccus inhibens]RJS20114.1 hypothetical protein DRW03_20350 [Corallococcus sp. H22C18031201]
MTTLRTLSLSALLLAAGTTEARADVGGATPRLAMQAETGKGAASPKLESGTPFTAAYIVEHWRLHPDSPPLENTPSAQAPGYVAKKLVVGASAGDLKLPGASEMSKKLQRILEAMKANPALKNVRGVSLGQGVALGMSRGGPMEKGIAGKTYLMAFPLRLEDKSTVHRTDGTYYTPGEGDSLNVVVNDPSLLETTPEVLGTYNGHSVVRVGSGLGVVVLNTKRPLTVTVNTPRGPQQELNPDLMDASRPPADIQMLVAYLGSGTPTWNDLARGNVSPTSGPGRLLGALFTMDWKTLVTQKAR